MSNEKNFLIAEVRFRKSDVWECNHWIKWFFLL